MNHRCVLCGNEIEHYHQDFNCLKIDDGHSVDICSDCVQKFLAWQQKKFATLFPTRRAKKFIKSRKE